MEVITSTHTDAYYQECCTECGALLVNFGNIELVCERCGTVAERKQFDFHESRTIYNWHQRYRDKKLWTHQRDKYSLSYRILNRKIKRSYLTKERIKLFHNEIARLCGQLELPSHILRDAVLYGKGIINALPAYTHLSDVLATATALVWGCSFIYSPRTLQEIMAIAHPIVTRNKVLHAANKFVFTRLINKSPRMLENKQFTSLVNWYIEHFGAVLALPIATIQAAKDLFKQLGYKHYTIRPDIQSIALLWCVCRRKQGTERPHVDELKKRLKEAIHGYEKGHRVRSQILEVVIQHPGISVKELANRLQKPYHTIYYHIQKLKAAGFLSAMKNPKKHGRTRTIFSVTSQKFARAGVWDEPLTPQLSWTAVSEKCFITSRTPKKIIKDIARDMKKVNVCVSYLSLPAV